MPYQPGTPGSDQVPTSGPWQQDPTLRQLMQAAMAAGTAARGSQTAGQLQAWQALNRYVAANRQRLGIPNNYYPDPKTQGQTLYDPNQNQLRDAAITGGALAAGGYGLGALLEGPTQAATSASQATGGLLPNTTPVPYSAVSLMPPTTPLGGVAAAPAATTAAGAAGGSALDRLRSSLTSPNGVAQLAALIPMLSMATSGGGGGNGQDAGELDRIRAITEARMRRADPLHQVAVQLAYGRAPLSARQGIALNNVQLPE
ncbi:MAG: hypothetical protein RLZZ373_374 [Pseudomonadota bacterium]|jgi:hypothetical protein